MTTEYNQKARAKAIERLGESWVLHPDYKSKKNPAHTYREGSYILKKRRKHGR